MTAVRHHGLYVTNSTKKDRLAQYLEYKGIGPTAFARALGISNSHVSEINQRKNNRTLYLAIQSVSDYSDCNIDWLETGEGEMIRTPQAGYPHGTDKFKAFSETVSTVGDAAIAPPEGFPTPEHRLLWEECLKLSADEALEEILKLRRLKASLSKESHEGE